MRRRRRGSVAVSMVTVALSVLGSTVAEALPAGAASITVTTTADGVPGSLRAAIDTANAADTPTMILLAAGAEYDLTVCDGDPGQEDDNATGDLDYTASAPLEIIGFPSTIAQTCARGDHERVLDSTGGANLNIINTTITGGHAEVGVSGADSSGGGISSTGPLLLSDAIVTGNSASDVGGGVAARDSTVTAAGAHVSGNSAGRNGGGIYADSLHANGNLFLEGNTAAWFGGGAVVHSAQLWATVVRGNRADDGAGGLLVDGDLLVRQSVFSDNSTDGVAGGLLGGDPSGASTADVTTSTFMGNTATSGAGAFLFGRTVSVANSTFTDNTATVFGGGLHAAAGDAVTLTFDTFVANGAPIAGNLYLGTHADVDTDGPASLFGTLLADPVDGPVSCATEGTTAVSDGYNYDTTGSACGFTDPTDVTNGADPQLEPLAYNDGVTLDFAPAPSSPLVDVVPLTDPRCTGFDQTLITVRPQNEGCEIGSVEITHAEAPRSDPGADPPPSAGPAPQTPADPQVTG